MRVPSVGELSSIVNLGNNGSPPCIVGLFDDQFFGSFVEKINTGAFVYFTCTVVEANREGKYLSF